MMTDPPKLPPAEGLKSLNEVIARLPAKVWRDEKRQRKREEWGASP
jgi:hypothetical protein